MDVDGLNLNSNTPQPTPTKKSIIRNKRRSKSSEVSLTASTLKSILKRKGDQTAGKKSIAMRKSSIKFSKVVSARVVDGSSDEDSMAEDRRHRGAGSAEDMAKSVIESTLIKSAEILSDFTENTLCLAGSYIKSFIASNRFRIKSPYRQSRSRPWNSTSIVSPSAAASNMSVGKTIPDMEKLPPNIAQLLKSDSDSSLGGSSKGTKKSYHSKKMALRQYNVSNKLNGNATKLKAIADAKIPDIIVVSAPTDSKFKLSTTLDEDDNVVKDSNDQSQQTYESEITSVETETERTAVDETPLPTVYPKAATKTVGTYKGTSKLLRKPHKLQLGVEKGVVFVLGPKTKSPYVNTFGDVNELNSFKSTFSSRKWVLNIGNFLDTEMSFSILEKSLTITGFRHPTIKYPDGQAVSLTITVPSNFDVKNLRIYRPRTAKDVLVLEEIDGK